MKIGSLKETAEAEARVAMTPDSALQLQKLGHTCFIESGAGLAAGFTDTAYEAAVTATDGQGRFTFLGVPAGQYVAPCRCHDCPLWFRLRSLQGLGHGHAARVK